MTKEEYLSEAAVAAKAYNAIESYLEGPQMWVLNETENELTHNWDYARSLAENGYYAFKDAKQYMDLANAMEILATIAGKSFIRSRERNEG